MERSFRLVLALLRKEETSCASKWSHSDYRRVLASTFDCPPSSIARNAQPWGWGSRRKRYRFHAKHTQDLATTRMHEGRTKPLMLDWTKLQCRFSSCYEAKIRNVLMPWIRMVGSYYSVVTLMNGIIKSKYFCTITHWIWPTFGKLSKLILVQKFTLKTKCWKARSNTRLVIIP
jgi:hypothetical protein